MCTPIFPNTAHPDHRLPVYPEPTLPFANCYHWTLTDMEIRVLTRPEGFNDEEAIKLPAMQRVILRKLQDGDKWAMHCDTNPQPVQPLAQVEELPPVSEDDISDESDDCSEADEDSVDTILEMLGNSRKNIELMPLCHLWLDIAAQFEQDTIPNPLQFYEERDAIIRSVITPFCFHCCSALHSLRIIQDARARNPSLPPLVPPHPLGLVADLLSSHHDSQALDDDRSNYSFHADPPPIRELCMPLTHLTRYSPPVIPGRSLLLHIRRLGRRLVKTFRFPYIPVWP